jgi:hypothetical protein
LAALGVLRGLPKTRLRRAPPEGPGTVAKWRSRPPAHPKWFHGKVLRHRSEFANWRMNVANSLG